MGCPGTSTRKFASKVQLFQLARQAFIQLWLPAGDCPAVPVGQELVPREGRLHPMWLLEAAAHVYHCVPRHDQPDPLSR